MSLGTVLSFVFGILGPISLLVACVMEFLARRLAKDPRCDKTLLEKRRRYADIALVAAWILLAAAYLVFQSIAPDAEAWRELFQKWMTGMLIALVAIDIVYLYLRRGRPRAEGQRKRFWEI